MTLFKGRDYYDYYDFDLRKTTEETFKEKLNEIIEKKKANKSGNGLLIRVVLVFMSGIGDLIRFALSIGASNLLMSYIERSSHIRHYHLVMQRNSLLIKVLTVCRTSDDRHMYDIKALCYNDKIRLK